MGGTHLTTAKKPKTAGTSLTLEPILSYHDLLRRRSRELYETLSARTYSAKELLIATFSMTKSPLSTFKNYDGYYGFLSTHIIPTLARCSTSEGSVEDLASKGSRISKAFAPPAQPTRKFYVKPQSRAKATKPISRAVMSTPKNVSPKPAAKKEQLQRDNASAKNLKLPQALPRFETQTPAKSLDRAKSKPDIISLLPENVIAMIFEYLIDQYPRCLLVCVPWYASLLGALDSSFNLVETKLAQKYVDCALFRNSYACFRKQGEDNTRSRVDRIIQLELLNGIEGNTLTIGYTYRFSNEPNSTYVTKYKIDCKPRSSERTVWIHSMKKDKGCTVTAYTANTIPVCAGDFFEISINYFTLRGLIDLSSLEWMEPTIEPTPVAVLYKGLKERASLTPEQMRAIGENMGRICELEQMEGEWYDSTYYGGGGKSAGGVITGINNFFEILNTEYSPVDPNIKKVTLRPIKRGNFALIHYTNRLGP